MFKDLLAKLQEIYLDHFYTGVMVDWMIASYIRRGKIKVTDFDPSLINPASLDIRLSRFYSVMDSTGEVDPLDKSTYSYKRSELDHYVMESNEAILASTHEVVGLPNNVSARLIGKSSLARVHADNSSFGCWIDCGFCGTIVLEFVNHSKFPIKLTSGMKVGQLVIFKHGKASIPYNKKADSKYMNQQFAEGSMYWKNAK